METFFSNSLFKLGFLFFLSLSLCSHFLLHFAHCVFPKQYLPAVFPTNSRCIYISVSSISAGQQAESYSWLSCCPIGAALVASARTSGPRTPFIPPYPLFSTCSRTSNAAMKFCAQSTLSWAHLKRPHSHFSIALIYLICHALLAPPHGSLGFQQLALRLLCSLAMLGVMCAVYTCVNCETTPHLPSHPSRHPPLTSAFAPFWTVQRGVYATLRNLSSFVFKPKLLTEWQRGKRTNLIALP